MKRLKKEDYYAPMDPYELEDEFYFDPYADPTADPYADQAQEGDPYAAPEELTQPAVPVSDPLSNVTTGWALNDLFDGLGGAGEAASGATTTPAPASGAGFSWPSLSLGQSAGEVWGVSPSQFPSSGPAYSEVPTLAEEAFGIGPAAPTSPAMYTPAGELGIASQLPAFVPPAALAAITAYTTKKGFDGYKAGEGRGTLGGFKAGLNEAGPLKFVPILGQAPAIAGAIGGTFGSKKGGDQRNRDSYRGDLKGAGIIDNDYKYQTPDGRYFDVGAESLRDLNADPTIRSVNLDGLTPGGKSYNINFDNLTEEESQDIGSLDALLGSGLYLDKKGTSDITGQFFNAGRLSGGTRGVVDDIKNRIDQAYGPEAAKILSDNTAAAWREGKISAGERDARFATIGRLYSIGNPNNTRWEDSADLTEDERRRNTEELGSSRKLQIDQKRGVPSPNTMVIPRNPNPKRPRVLADTDRKLPAINPKRGVPTPSSVQKRAEPIKIPRRR